MTPMVPMLFETAAAFALAGSFDDGDQPARVRLSCRNELAKIAPAVKLADIKRTFDDCCRSAELRHEK